MTFFPKTDIQTPIFEGASRCFASLSIARNHTITEDETFTRRRFLVTLQRRLNTENHLPYAIIKFYIILDDT